MIQIPTPSINANKIAPTAADLTAADGPPTDDEKFCLAVMFGGVWRPYGWWALVSALVRNIVFCSWARHFMLTVPLSTQVYKWGLAILIRGRNHVMD